VTASPRRLEEDTSHVGIAGLGDSSLSPCIAARMLARDDTAVRHQLLGGLEAREASDLDRDRRRTELADSA